jgi:glycerate 2-kinase
MPSPMSEKTLRRHARQIFRASLQAADPVQAVLRHCRLKGETLFAGKRAYRLDRFRQIYVIGAGKASAAMAQAVEKLLGRRISGGSVTVKYGHGAPLKRIEVREAGHPVPDQAGLAGAVRIAEIARQAGPEDLVICLISGGASSLTPLPSAPVTLAEKQETTRLLLECGADIKEINTVRKHLSDFKGGQLARLAAPATLLSLMLSDVIGDPLDAIGSGPTVADTTTFADAQAILERYDLLDKAPPGVVERIRKGVAGEIPDTPKPGDPVFEKTYNLIVGSNRLAVQAARDQARRLGYRTLVLSTMIEGETRDVARVHAAIAKEIQESGQPLPAPACVVSGGETTVTLRGQGLGGRNQEFVLAAAIDLAGRKNIVVLSGGTDGTDGPTDAAGAIADGQTVARAAALGRSAAASLADNDSYHFFAGLGDLVKTGPTRTNVMDVRLLLVGSR